MFCFSLWIGQFKFSPETNCYTTVEIWFLFNCIPDVQAHGIWHWQLAACCRTTTLAHHITGWSHGRWWAPNSPWHQYQSQGLLFYLKWNQTKITWHNKKNLLAKLLTILSLSGVLKLLSVIQPILYENFTKF